MLYAICYIAFYQKLESMEIYCLSSITRHGSYCRNTSKSLLSSDIYGSTTALNYGNRSYWSMFMGSFVCCYDVLGAIYRYVWFILETLTYMLNCEGINKRNFHDRLYRIYVYIYDMCGYILCCGGLLSGIFGSGSSGAGEGGEDVRSHRTGGRYGGMVGGVLTHTGTVTNNPLRNSNSNSTPKSSKRSSDDKGSYHSVSTNEHLSDHHVDDDVISAV